MWVVSLEARSVVPRDAPSKCLFAVGAPWAPELPVAESPCRTWLTTEVNYKGLPGYFLQTPSGCAEAREPAAGRAHVAHVSRCSGEALVEARLWRVTSVGAGTAAYNPAGGRPEYCVYDTWSAW